MKSREATIRKWNYWVNSVYLCPLSRILHHSVNENVPGFPILTFPSGSSLKTSIIKKRICLGFFLTEIQKLNRFANKARKTNPLCFGWAIRLTSQTQAEPAQLCSHKAIWEKIFMAAAEMFLPKQHLHFAGVIFRGGFPYCCVNCQNV